GRLQALVQAVRLVDRPVREHDQLYVLFARLGELLLYCGDCAQITALADYHDLEQVPRVVHPAHLLDRVTDNRFFVSRRQQQGERDRWLLKLLRTAVESSTLRLPPDIELHAQVEQALQGHHADDEQVDGE